MVVSLTATQEEEELEFSETSESEESDEMTSDEEITKTPALKSSQTNEVSYVLQRNISQDLLYRRSIPYLTEVLLSTLSS